MRRSRKPLSVVRRIESSNLSPSACRAGSRVVARDPALRLDDQVGDRKREPVQGGVRAAFLEPGGVLVAERERAVV